jgi:hypothetical protein
MDEQRCVSCENPFRGRSKPLWAFDRDGRPLGRVHSSCRRARILTDPAAAQDVAQLRVWEWDVRRPRPEAHSDRWRAGMLIGWENAPVSETLTEAQETLIQHWTDGGLHLEPSRAENIRAIYAAIVHEFRAWRAALGSEVA